jgi:hypothetical protein
VIYSGGGIVVSCVAERLTHQSYETLMRHRVFGPLRMVNAGFGCMATEGTIDGPWGHVIENGHVKPIPPDRAMAIQVRAAVGKNVHCSIIDLARFAAFHSRGDQEGSPLLRPETFRRLHTAVPHSNFAPGWSIEHDKESPGPILAHNGSIGQNYAVCRVFPSERIAACVMTNLGSKESDAACERILSWLIALSKRGRFTTDDRLAARPTNPRPDIPLETLVPLRVTTGFGHVRLGRTAADTPMYLDGVPYRQGVGVHANSELEFDLKPEYERFVGLVGVDDKQGWHGTIVVKVYAGGELLRESPVLRGGDAPWAIDVRLPGVREGVDPGRIRLVVDGTPDGTSWDLTDWIHAGFIARRTDP